MIALTTSIDYKMLLLQDQESGEDDDPEEFSESSLGVVGIRETRDVCACHEVLGIVSKDNISVRLIALITFNYIEQCNFIGTFNVTHGI